MVPVVRSLLAPWCRLWPLALCLALQGPPAAAEAIGMLKAPTRLGLTVGAGMASYADPAGSTRTGVLRARYALRLERDLAPAWRGSVATALSVAHWPADARRIGADGQNYDLAAGLARRLGPADRGLWLETALRAEITRLHNRHTVDADGYLARVWPDRRGTGLGLDLGLAADRVLRPGWRAGWRLLLQRRLAGTGFDRFVLAFSFYPVP